MEKFPESNRGEREEYRSRLPAVYQHMTYEEIREQRRKIEAYFVAEQPAAVLSVGYSGDDGTVFGSSAGDRDPKAPIPPPSIVITPEHYNRIYRLLSHEIPVKLEVEVKAQLLDPQDSVNVIAEIPGGAKKDHVVMLGAHLDFWQGGTGATDNGAGSAVMIEEE